MYVADTYQTFYLNLDLTSLHGVLRPPRRRQPSVSVGEQDDDITSNPPINTNNNNAFTPIESAETESLPTDQIQILGLHTSNPIVSYHNQIFSCSWADQIGTELIFSPPDSDLDSDNLTAPLQRGPAFELLAANSVKILGRKANLTSSSGLAQEPDESTAGSVPPALDQLGEAPGLPRRAPPSDQARFIEQLQNIKTARGETDTVRTVMSLRRNVNLAERLRGWARTEEQLTQIQRLNERARAGDVGAWANLEQLFSEMNRTDTASTSASSPQP